MEVAEDDLEVLILDDANQQERDQEGRYIKNKWVDDQKYKRGRTHGLIDLGEELEDLQGKASDPSFLNESVKKRKKIKKAKVKYSSKKVETAVEEIS